MKNKFTKGEWKYEEQANGLDFLIFSGGRPTRLIAITDESTVADKYRDKKKAEANAKLIAAAPAMYQACIAAITAFDLHYKFGNDIDARHAAEEDAFYLLKQAIKATE